MFTRKNGNCARSIARSLAGPVKSLVVGFAALLLSATGVFAQGTGIGGYDLRSVADLSIPFDYNSSGYADHLLFYRPGTGTVYILSNTSEGTVNPLSFAPIYASGNGIGGYDLKSPADRIIAFDYDGSGKKDHLLCYRPGSGVVFIIANNNGSFSPVYASGSGIGGYDLSSTSDEIMAFDYDGSGLSDHLVLYRPGGGLVTILANSSGTFTPVYASNNGIGGYDLQVDTDRAFAFDYYGYGVADHLVMYRPGQGTVWILEQRQGAFYPVFQSGGGIGSWDLKVGNDQMFAYDYNGTGHYDHIVAYRPGTGSIQIIGSAYFAFSTIYAGGGIAGYDLLSQADKIVPVDVSGTGIFTQLMVYRPGDGVVRILSNTDGVFNTLFANQ